MKQLFDKQTGIYNHTIPKNVLTNDYPYNMQPINNLKLPIVSSNNDTSKNEFEIKQENKITNHK